MQQHCKCIYRPTLHLYDLRMRDSSIGIINWEEVPPTSDVIVRVINYKLTSMLGRKVALITGAAQGIGLATARLLLRNGARVSVSCLAYVE